MEEIMFGGVNLFLLKTGSRNQFNNLRKDGYFLEHYHRMWGIRLYPYENAFKICEENKWKFIFVLQDGSLKTVQEELTLTKRRNPATERYTVKKGWRIKEEYRYQTDIEYHKKYTLNWVQCIETRTKTIQQQETTTPLKKQETSCFEYVTNITPATLLQIAHTINQLLEKGKCITEILKLRPKETIHNLWVKLKAYMIFIKPVIISDLPEYERNIRPAPT